MTNQHQHEKSAPLLGKIRVSGDGLIVRAMLPAKKRVSRQLVGIVASLALIAVLATPGLAAQGPADPSPYSVEGETGSEVYLFGDAAFHGSLEQADLETAVVGFGAHPNQQGYWIATADGAVSAYGASDHHGDASTYDLGGAIVDIAPTTSGEGYWLLGQDGGVMTFGDAGFHGSTGNIELDAPVVALAPTPSGNGYWLAARDGGVFTFGDAGFHGSGANLGLTHAVKTIIATPSGKGYWLFSLDGGVFSFGDARFLGSLSGQLDGEEFVDAAPTLSGNGYWMAGESGTVAAFGDASEHGGLAAGGDEPVAAIAVTPSGHGYWLATTPGRTADGVAVPANSGSGRRIVYSNSGQRVWLIADDDRVVTSYLVSGKANTPARGTYQVYSKSPVAWATHDGITMEYMVRFAYGKRLSIGFHSIPKYGNGVPMQTPEQLGTYQSGGCVRQHIDQAKFLYDWTDIGTKVIVVA
ncbi:MAG: L,D-transpeptidase [Actinomycetota bacterium]|nr:L,D-transpeptidase [Actinomycetota bacterium]